jgi:hypothetical protein
MKKMIIAAFAVSALATTGASARPFHHHHHRVCMIHHHHRVCR